MQKRSSKSASRDINQIASRIVAEATGNTQERVVPEQKEKNPAAVALGRMGGKVGGKARAEKLTSEQRKEIARIAASARWKKSDS